MKPFEKSDRIIFAGIRILPPKAPVTAPNGKKVYGFTRLYQRLVKHPKEWFVELLEGGFVSEESLTDHERTLLIIAQTAMQELEKSTRERSVARDKKFWRVKEVLIPKEATDGGEIIL